MTNEVIVRDHSIRDLIPFDPMPYDDAVRKALGERAGRNGPADDRRLFEPAAGTHHVRPAGLPAPRPFPRGPRRAGHGPARRRRVVTATGIGGAGLLGISLSTKAGSAQFYLLTMGLAGTWAAGALSSGPLPLTLTQGREDARRHPVVMPMLTGAAAFGLFYGTARLARHIPPSTAPSAASCAMQTMVPLASCCSPHAPTRQPRNCSSAAHSGRRAGLTPTRQDHPRLRCHHRRDPQPRARARRNRDQRALRLQRAPPAASGRRARPDFTWSLLDAARPPPLFQTPGRPRSPGTDRTGGVADDGRQRTSPTQNQKICARQPMNPAQLSAAPSRRYGCF